MDNPFIGRIVVFLTPVIAAMTAVIVNAVQDWFGIALDGTQLSVLLTGAVVASVAVVYKWLDNRGKYEEILQGVEAVGGPSFADPVPPEPDAVEPEPVEGKETLQPPPPERRGA